MSLGALAWITEQYDEEEEEGEEEEEEEENAEPTANGRPRASRKRPPSPSPPLAAAPPPPRKLPLPSSLQNMFAAETAALKQGPAEDPSLHQGRVRSFAHQRGNWATYAHIPAPWDQDDLDALQERLRAALAASDDDDDEPLVLEAVPDPHLSLTRVVTLRHHWIESFAASARDAAAALTPAFTCSPSGSLAAFVNEEKTRTFLGLRVGSPVLPELVERLDRDVLAQFNLPPFYRPAEFHVSVLWCLGDRGQRLRHCLPRLEAAVADLRDDVLAPFRVTQVHGKCGNKTFVWPLAKN